MDDPMGERREEENYITHEKNGKKSRFVDKRRPLSAGCACRADEEMSLTRESMWTDSTVL